MNFINIICLEGSEMMSWNAVSRVEILVLSCLQAVQFRYEGCDLVDDVIVFMTQVP